MKKEFEQYEHHGSSVWTRSATKGKHRDLCLCYSCKLFKPGYIRNCYRAKLLYRFCVDYEMVIPVFECPHFEAIDDSNA